MGNGALNRTLGLQATIVAGIGGTSGTRDPNCYRAFATEHVLLILFLGLGFLVLGLLLLGLLLLLLGLLFLGLLVLLLPLVLVLSLLVVGTGTSASGVGTCAAR